MLAVFHSVNRILYGKRAWTKVVSIIFNLYIYIHRFSVLYGSFPIVLQFPIRAQVYKPILRHKVVQFPGAAETVARQMPGMIVRLLSRRVSYIRQTPGNGSSFFS